MLKVKTLCTVIEQYLYPIENCYFIVLVFVIGYMLFAGCIGIMSLGYVGLIYTNRNRRYAYLNYFNFLIKFKCIPF